MFSYRFSIPTKFLQTSFYCAQTSNALIALHLGEKIDNGHRSCLKTSEYQSSFCALHHKTIQWDRDNDVKDRPFEKCNIKKIPSRKWRNELNEYITMSYGMGRCSRKWSPLKSFSSNVALRWMQNIIGMPLWSRKHV